MLKEVFTAEVINSVDDVIPKVSMMLKKGCIGDLVDFDELEKEVYAVNDGEYVVKMIKDRQVKGLMMISSCRLPRHSFVTLDVYFTREMHRLIHIFEDVLFEI